MNMVHILEKKKQRQALTQQELTYFANGAANGSIPDYQLAALLMAIRLNGMNREETAQLTLAMANSGEMADLSSLHGVPTDKHSTGGVGDTTTLVLVPLVAACGVPVAKMSGRGLGHTGGTLDKLESIPGFTVGLSQDAFLRQVREIGCAVIGQTQNLAPADKALYALRDVTATVDSMPLIAASIMSKKLASGAQAIVLDVKTGSGALMQTTEESIALAQMMVRIGRDAGRKMVALVTDMAEPLGSHVGNALEVKEAIDVLCGRVEGPLLAVSLELGARMITLGGEAPDVPAAKQKLLTALHSGDGIRMLARMIEAQGGDAACCSDVSKLAQASTICAAP
ncbi:MAG: thymidine phosphorylase, partial [Clostridia bacterium]